ncbi:MAG TPA: hypothetical protein VD999_01210 [Vitreimonas sp.]|nr:hypothetical protein [Vitreimonas sp.]
MLENLEGAGAAAAAGVGNAAVKTSFELSPGAQKAKQEILEAIEAKRQLDELRMKAERARGSVATLPETEQIALINKALSQPLEDISTETHQGAKTGDWFEQKGLNPSTVRDATRRSLEGWTVTGDKRVVEREKGALTGDPRQQQEMVIPEVLAAEGSNPEAEAIQPAVLPLEVETSPSVSAENIPGEGPKDLQTMEPVAPPEKPIINLAYLRQKYGTVPANRPSSTATGGGIPVNPARVTGTEEYHQKRMTRRIDEIKNAQPKKGITFSASGSDPQQS